MEVLGYLLASAVVIGVLTVIAKTNDNISSDEPHLPLQRHDYNKDTREFQNWIEIQKINKPQ